MFGSYTATVKGPFQTDDEGHLSSGGKLEMYAAADPDIILGQRQIISVNHGHRHGMCDPTKTSGKFDAATSSFVFSTTLCPVGPCSKTAALQACPEQFVPSQFDYMYGKTESNALDISVDTRTLSLALAVNFGMLSIKDLDMVEKDDQLTAALSALYMAKQISLSDSKSIFGFIDHKTVPMEPVYCMLLKGKSGLVAETGVSFNGGEDDDAQTLDEGSPPPSPSPTAAPTNADGTVGNLYTYGYLFTLSIYGVSFSTYQKTLPDSFNALNAAWKSLLYVDVNGVSLPLPLLGSDSVSLVNSNSKFFQGGVINITEVSGLYVTAAAARRRALEGVEVGDSDKNEGARGEGGGMPFRQAKSRF